MTALYLILIGAAAGAELQQLDCKTSGKTFYKECNKCYCSLSGLVAGCTQMECPPGVYDGKGNFLGPQRPEIYKQQIQGDCSMRGKIFYKECNTCYCSLSGTIAGCTQIECPPGIYNGDENFSGPEKPGASKREFNKK